MRVVADSHALVRYLVDPERLSEPALEALLEAENTDGVVISAATMTHFGSVPLDDLRDPFDRFILATVAQLGVPLVTADRSISKAGVVEIIW